MPFGNAVGEGFTNAGIVIADKVIVFGGNNGVFVYQGTPGLGNPPVGSMVSPSTSSDPYGNAVDSILEIGNRLGAHVQIDQFGQILIYNSAGALIFVLNPADEALFVYSPSAGAGNLAVSVAAVSGTDFFGNSYLQGVGVYGTGGAYAQLTDGVLNFQGATGQNSPAQIITDNLAGIIEASSGKKTAGDSAALLDLISRVASGVSRSQAVFSVDENIFNGSISSDGGIISSDGAGNLTIGNDFTLTPKMATPPNTAAVKAGTATLAQTESCLGSLIQSMQNRGMIT